MKKFRIFIMALLFIVAMPYVKAATASTSLTGNNSIKVGETTTIYVKVNSSSPLKGVDLTYSTSGNISVVSTSPIGGMSLQSSNGNRMLLYSMSDVASGSSVFAITVKGNSAGSGTVGITNLQATVNEGGGVYETAYGNTASYQISITAQQTQPTNNNTNTNTSNNSSNKTITTKTQKEKEEEKKAKEEKEAKEREEKEAKEREEKEAKEKEEKLNLNKAIILVEAAEKSLLQDDLDAALEAVNKLNDSEEKENLLKRLDDVKFKVAVKDECVVDTVGTKVDPNDDIKKWIILSTVLFLLAIGEFIYIIVKRKKDNDD